MIKLLSPKEVDEQLETESKFKKKIQRMFNLKNDHLILEFLKEKNLTEFEILQIISLRPKTLLCLTVIVEELNERFSDEEIKEILNFLMKL